MNEYTVCVELTDDTTTFNIKADLYNETAEWFTFVRSGKDVLKVPKHRIVYIQLKNES